MQQIISAQPYQDYKSLPTANAMWRETFGGFEAYCEDYQYLITGDTLINDLVYHKLQKTGARYYWGWEWSCDFNNPVNINYYAGCFRNDTSTQRVYYIEPGVYSEKVIYDFSLSVGDTIPAPFNYEFYTIASIDSIEIESIYHKRFLIDNKSHMKLYIIEGIGSTYGLLSPHDCPFESSFDLICFSINEEPVYINPNFWWKDCTPIIYNTIENHHNDKTMITSYPNPAHNIFQIKGLDHFQDYNVSIYNIYGQLVKQVQVLHFDDIIYIETLHKGIYIVNICNKENVLAKCKLIKL